MHTIIFGDSISQGFFDTESGGWTTLLSELLQKKTLDSRFAVYNSVFNLSISGETTTEIVSRFDSEIVPRVSDKKQNIFIFAGGINDVRKSNNGEENDVSLGDSENNIRNFLHKVERVSGKCLIMGLTCVDETLSNPYGSSIFLNSDIEQYDKMIERIANESQVTYIRVSDVIKIEHLADGVHPNAEGHRLIFERVKSVLEEENLL